MHVVDDAKIPSFALQLQRGAQTRQGWQWQAAIRASQRPTVTTALY